MIENTKMTTSTFSFANTETMIQSLGVQDQLIKRLEFHFPQAQILLRSHDVIVTANDQDVEHISQILKDLQVLGQSGASANDRVLDQLFNQYKDLESDSSRKNNKRQSVNKDGEQQKKLIEQQVVKMTEPVMTFRGKQVRPKTFGQAAYVQAIEDHDVVFGIGAAGTGKTYLAVALAVTALKNKEVERIILTRPAVEAGERLGFLPGGLNEKIDPYVQPLYDALKDMIDPVALSRYMEMGIIEVAPLAYMRGRTLNNAFIILDEGQNTTAEQMKMFLTRLGQGSKMVVTGDNSQVDLPQGKRSGLDTALHVLSKVDDIGFSYLTSQDVVRHGLVSSIIEAYDREENNNS